LLLALVACDAAAAPPAKRSFTDKLQAVHDRMHARFGASQRIELAIAFGDLERSRTEARTIAELEEPDVLPEWQPYFANVQAAAGTVVASEDLVAAAKASALLASRCASCHAAIAAKIVFPKDPAPKEDPRLSTQMASHRWAVGRMREGLVGPANERWLEGARTLAKAPLTLTAESDELGIADDVARVRLFARRALTAKPGDRAALYGDLLATCARCHHAIRDVRPPAQGK
jgi:cytochrome c553